MLVLDQIVTSRLLLLRISHQDFDELDLMHRDPQVMATLGGVRSTAQTIEFLDRELDHWQRNGFGLWVVRDISTGRFAGRGGLRHTLITGSEHLEIVFGFMPGFWGRGLATELARESVRMGFSILNKIDLISLTLPTNDASRKVMEKVGLQHERDILDDELTLALYRITAPQWHKTEKNHSHV